MDPARNPFAPGAGYPPPELAGRDKTFSDSEIARQRVLRGRIASRYGLTAEDDLQRLASLPVRRRIPKYI